MISTKLKATAIFLVVGLIFTSLMNAHLTLAWSGLGSFSPYNVYQGVVAQFDFSFQNSGSGSLDVYWVWVSFCWNPSNYGYYFKANDGSTVSIPGGGSHDFTDSIQVDQTTTGNCVVSVQVNGKAVGDIFAQTLTWPEAVNVLLVPALQLSISANWWNRTLHLLLLDIWRWQ